MFGEHFSSPNEHLMVGLGKSQQNMYTFSQPQSLGLGESLYFDLYGKTGSKNMPRLYLKKNHIFFGKITLKLKKEEKHVI